VTGESRSFGTIRIVAGAKRGHRLKVPRSQDMRPTSELVREAVFDVLGPVDGLRALDLFAGTGALGLEALSRGGASCVFVERDPAIAEVLQSNIAALGYLGSSRVIVADYQRTLGHLAGAASCFDLLFLDPPYRMLPDVEVVLGPLLPSLLSQDGVAVIEGPRALPASFGQDVVFERAYGDTRITMIKIGRNASEDRALPGHV